MYAKNNKGLITAIIAARMNSSRMPGKSMALLCGIPSLEHIINRLKASRFIDQIIVATTTNNTDDKIRECAKMNGVLCFSGSEDDVLDRTVKAGEISNSEHVVIVNGDSPIIDPYVVDCVISAYFKNNADYASNSWKESWPVGTEAEICRLATLQKINTSSTDPAYHEHVTLELNENRNKYKMIDVTASSDEMWPELRLTLDTQEDYKLISYIYENLYPSNQLFGIKEIVEFLKQKPEFVRINSNIKQKDIR
ncbi:MAG: glycosyltransferase family protein [Firmicutes bacterium]|nr:glycosyltransferase family protein [Bacillota bacterium]